MEAARRLSEAVAVSQEASAALQAQSERAAEREEAWGLSSKGLRSALRQAMGKYHHINLDVRL